MSTEQQTLSAVEYIKANSNHLRGTLLEALADPLTGDINEADFQLLKFHGSYRQDDRDLRDERRLQKLEPAFSYMLRLRLPGGVLSPQQWLALDAVAERYGNGTMRITTRQAIQLHGIRKPQLKPAIAAINQARLDTRSACGDVNRNVICAANPDQSALHATVYALADKLSRHLLAKSTAYDEIWLGQKKTAAKDDDPIYGTNYLPRKFKIALAIPPANDVDVLAHDLGFITIIQNDKLIGFNVSVGGGMGMSYDKTNTYPRLASVIGYIPVEQIMSVAETVVAIQRDHGNRAERHRARLKYTIDTHGLDWFKAELNRRLGLSLEKARAYHFDFNGDRFGWVQGGDKKWHLTLALNAGRIDDQQFNDQLQRWRTGLYVIADQHKGELRLTCNQNLIIANVTPKDRKNIDQLVKDYGLDTYQSFSAVRRLSMACVALPTCGLAMAEAERYLPDFVTKLEKVLDKHGLLQLPIVLRLSGCPNGCSRPYLAEIALTGKAPGRYNLYLGGSFAGERLAALYRENINEQEILTTLDALFSRFAEQHQPDEYFGDFLHRINLFDQAA